MTQPGRTNPGFQARQAHYLVKWKGHTCEIPRVMSRSTTVEIKISSSIFEVDR